MNAVLPSVSILNPSFRSVTLLRILWAIGLVAVVLDIVLGPKQSLGNLGVVDGLSKWSLAAVFAIGAFFNPAARNIPDSFVVDEHGLSTSYGNKRGMLVPLSELARADVSPGGPMLGPPWQSYTVTLYRKPTVKGTQDVPIVREWRGGDGSIRIPGEMTLERAQRVARDINELIGAARA